jgi:hypothetical protein
MSNFSLAKKRPGIYFNDGELTFSVQAPDKLNGKEGPLLEAIRAARAEFCRVYFSGLNKDNCPPQLKPDETQAREHHPEPAAGGAA